MSAALALAGMAALAWGTSDFLAGVWSRRVPVGTVLVWSKGAGAVLGLATILVRGQPAPDSVTVVLGVLAGLVGLPAMGLLYLAMRDSNVLVVAPIAAVAATIPLLCGIVGGERLGWFGLVGLVTTLLGITLANWPVMAARLLPARPITACYAGGAAAGIGAYFTLLHQASTTDPYWATAVARMTGGVAVVLISAGWYLRRPAGSTRPKARWLPLTPALLALIGILDSAGDAAFAFASTLGPLGVAAVLASLYSAVTVVLGAWILRERIHRLHAAGVVAATLGAACLGVWNGT